MPHIASAVLLGPTRPTSGRSLTRSRKHGPPLSKRPACVLGQRRGLLYGRCTERNWIGSSTSSVGPCTTSPENWSASPGLIK